MTRKKLSKKEITGCDTLSPSLMHLITSAPMLCCTDFMLEELLKSIVSFCTQDWRGGFGIDIWVSEALAVVWDKAQCLINNYWHPSALAPWCQVTACRTRWWSQCQYWHWGSKTQVLRQNLTQESHASLLRTNNYQWSNIHQYWDHGVG